MRVCLVSPPSVSQLRDPRVDPAAARAMAAESAPLGALTLAAVLEQRGWESRVVDLNRELTAFVRGRGEAAIDGFAAAVVERLLAERADAYGFTTIWCSYPFTLRVAKGLKRAEPSAVVVLGGPQASVAHAATIDAFPFVDSVVRGEADETFPLYLAALGGDGAAEDVPGVTMRVGGAVRAAPDAPPVGDLDALPFPAFHLYGDVGGFRHLPLELGRGCPFGCKFCSTNDFFGRRFRVKSPDRLIADMRRLNELYGATRFDLIHDMFTANRTRVVAFCEAMIAAGTGFEWYCSARTDCVDRELLALLAEAGCRSVFFGVETGSPRLQAAIQKHLDLEDAADRVHAASEAGMLTTVSLILGHHDETRDDLRATVSFLLDALRDDLVDPQLHLLTPLTDTPLEREFRGRLVLDDVHGDLSHAGWPQEPEDRALVTAHRSLFAGFYSLPLEHVERRYVQELRLFLYHAIPRHRWLLVALHQSGHDVLELFDDWRRWLRARVPDEAPDDLAALRFYGSDAWSGELLRFVEESCAVRAGTPLDALLEYSRALDAATAADGGSPSDAAEGAARRSAGVHVLRLRHDVTRLIASLRAGEPPERVRRARTTLVTRPRGHRLEVLEPSPLVVAALELSDGRRTAAELVEWLAAHPANADGLPPALLLLLLERLRDARFLEFDEPTRTEPTRRPPVPREPAAV